MKRDELTKTLELVGQALATNPVIPVFQSFLFQSKSVMAWNENIGIVADCKVEDDFVVHGKTLIGLLSNSNADEVTFSLKEEELVVRAGKSTWKLPYSPAIDFLFEPPELKPTVEFSLDEELGRGINACMTTTSMDETQQALQGVTIHQAGKNPVLYSCNGDAITRYMAKAKSAKMPDVVLPNPFCDALLKIGQSVEKNGGVLGIGEEWVFAEFEAGITIFAKPIIPAEPIDYEAEIKAMVKKQPPYVRVPESLNNALSRAMVVADLETSPTAFTVKGKELKLLTDTRYGVINDTMPFPHDDGGCILYSASVARMIGLCDEMALLGNCIVGKKGNVLQLISAMEAG